MSLNNLPKVIASEYIYDEYFKIRRDQLQLSPQEEHTYYTLLTAEDAVMILPKTSEGLYVLNWEYRHPTEKILLSCPGGVKYKNESAIQCAERELLEETGYTADTFKKIGEAYPFPGICNQKTIYIQALNAFAAHSQSLEKAEFIETVLFTKEELKAIIKEGAFVDGLLLTALFFDQNLLS